MTAVAPQPHNGQPLLADAGLGDVYAEALRTYNVLRQIEHAFWLLAAHYPSPSELLPGVCVACGHPWPCPQVRWATDWILTSHEQGILDELGLGLDRDVLDTLSAWRRPPALSGNTQPVAKRQPNRGQSRYDRLNHQAVTSPGHYLNPRPAGGTDKGG